MASKEVMNYDETKNYVRRCNKDPQMFKLENKKFFNCSDASE